MWLKRFLLIFSVLVVLGLLSGVGLWPAAAQGAPTGRTVTNLNVRSGPGEDNEVVGRLTRGVTVSIEGRNRQGNWLRVVTPDGSIRGWVAARYLATGNVDVGSLPIVSGEMIAPREHGPIQVDFSNEELLARLQAAPVLSPISNRTIIIGEVGRAQGRTANTFSKVGDCMTDDDAFLLPFGVGEYDLGPYAPLQETINFFSAVSPRPDAGVANSFVNDSMAAYTGFNAAAVLDPSWSDPAHCQPGETPLACEYRLVQPSVAIIMFGAVDMQYTDVQGFAHYLRQIVWLSVDRGIVPVLSTFPSSPEYLWRESLQFNNVILQIAEEEQVPLINFWLATRTLPNYGLQSDFFHLAHHETRRVNFNGEENQWGFTLRNLVTLQMLDELRRNVLTLP